VCSFIQVLEGAEEEAHGTHQEAVQGGNWRFPHMLTSALEQKKGAPAGEKLEPVRTHLHGMVIIPER
jgi:hypothetical protein